MKTSRCIGNRRRVMAKKEIGMDPVLLLTREIPALFDLATTLVKNLTDLQNKIIERLPKIKLPGTFEQLKQEGEDNLKCFVYLRALYAFARHISERLNEDCWETLENIRDNSCDISENLETTLSAYGSYDDFIDDRDNGFKRLCELNDKFEERNDFPVFLSLSFHEIQNIVSDQGFMDKQLWEVAVESLIPDRSNIQELLQANDNTYRIEWNCDKDVKDEGDNNRFWHSMQSRLDSWKRVYFPLDIINCLIKSNTVKSTWKDKIYECIDFLASDGNYYNIVNGGVSRLIFRRTSENEPFMVHAEMNNGKELRVMTPCADGSLRPMMVTNTRQVSVDHEIPLDIMIRIILEEYPKIKPELDKLILARKKHPKESPTAVIEAEGLNKDTVNVDLLVDLKKEVLKDTICVLMEQGENSKKSNIVTFKKYKRIDSDKKIFKLIVAEQVKNPKDYDKPYTIFKWMERHKVGEEQMEAE